MDNPRCAARCLLVVCVCLPVLAASGAAFEASADDAVAVTVRADDRPPDGARPGTARTEVHAGRVHVVYQPGVVTSVRIGDDVAVTVRPGCGCPGRPATAPPASRPSRPPSTHPPSTERAPAAPIRTAGPPPATATDADAPVEADPTPEPPNTRAPSAEPPPASRPSRLAAAPPDDDAAPSGFADGFAPALVVSILPAALAALLPGPGRRGVRP